MFSQKIMGSFQLEPSALLLRGLNALPDLSLDRLRSIQCACFLRVRSCRMTNRNKVPARARTWELPPQVKTRLVNGYEMAYLERGTGVPVILVHGSVSDYRYWITQIRPFSEHYRAISVSLRHCYPEPWDGTGDDFTIHQHLEDLSEFIRGLHAGPVHLVAHSYGADVALLLATVHSELLRSLVLAEPAPSLICCRPRRRRLRKLSLIGSFSRQPWSVSSGATSKAA